MHEFIAVVQTLQLYAEIDKLTFTRLLKPLLEPRFLVAALVLSLARKSVPYFVNYKYALTG